MTGQLGDPASFVTPAVFYFAEHRFEPPSGRLIRGEQRLRLRPKTAAVLLLLLRRAGEVVTKAELIDEVWDGTTSDESVAVCVAELRRALGEHPNEPRCIATVHRRGYRFIAPVTTAPQPTEVEPAGAGRALELAELSRWWDSARSGTRTVGFVTGEAGAGRTTLVHDFLTAIRTIDGRSADDPVAIGEGRCVDGRGGEPYLPFLDAFSAICRGPSGARFRELLWQVAPTWLLQMSGIVESSALDALRRRVADRPAGRLMREAAEVLDAMSAIAPVVIVIEDLHSGDRSTIDLFAHLAQRPTRARLLLVATSRPTPTGASGHALGDVIGGLGALRRCERLDLPPLGLDAVTSVLAARLSPGVPSDALAEEVLERTEGNALFVTLLADRLVSEGALRETDGVLRTSEPIAALGIPDGVRRLIVDRLSRLRTGDLDLLQAAAACGVDFAVVEVAAGRAALAAASHRGAGDETEVAPALADLAERTGVIVEAEPMTWADGSIGERYRFVHGLVRDVVHEQLGGAGRVAVHRAIGASHEAVAMPVAWAGATAEHFELGRDPARAVMHYARAADAARRRLAPGTALDLARRGIAIADSAGAVVPGSARLGLQLCLVAALLEEHGPTSPVVADAVDTAEVLADAVGRGPEVILARHLSWSVAFMAGDFFAASARLVAVEEAATGVEDPALELQVADARALTLLAEGSPALALEAGRVSVDRVSTAASDSDDERPHRRSEAAVLGRSSAAIASWLVGSAEDAKRLAHDGLRLAHETGAAGIVCRSLWPVIAVHQLRGERRRVQHHASELARAAEHEHPRWSAIAGAFDAWARLDDPDPAQAAAEVQQLVERLLADGMGFGRPYHLGLAAEGAAACGDTERAVVIIDAALAAVASTGDRWYLAELLRCRAEALLTLAAEHPSGRLGFTRAADALLDESLAIARSQGARALEVRALTTVVRTARPAADGPVASAAMLRDLLGVLGIGVGPVDRLAAELALRGTGLGSGEPVVSPTGTLLG
ncbi:winged helix-turn-helix domain-containing protein [Agromyces cerinus]|uniref:AAA ATPase domain-containing protein n=1 Tax=Agromyces cerinus subsp. cerinus TaxID=232089 RepID=A0A1N6ESS2_9MICO|nr:winged helix-turn-helix domain-containing protein [Agromyces cerinus]SIN86119.1 AAA ATPase domain-containing protein [Agromyces cerinus subsp. cerinus]